MILTISATLNDEQAIRDAVSQSITSNWTPTITWTGTTAPTGGTNLTYNYQIIKKISDVRNAQKRRGCVGAICWNRF